MKARAHRAVGCKHSQWDPMNQTSGTMLVLARRNASTPHLLIHVPRNLSQRGTLFAQRAWGAFWDFSQSTRMHRLHRCIIHYTPQLLSTRYILPHKYAPDPYNFLLEDLAKPIVLRLGNTRRAPVTRPPETTSRSNSPDTHTRLSPQGALPHTGDYSTLTPSHWCRPHLHCFLDIAERAHHTLRHFETSASAHCAPLIAAKPAARDSGTRPMRGPSSPILTR